MSISAMKQALEALESWQKTCLDVGRASDELGRATKAIEPLRQAIAEAEKQEPWVKTYCGGKPNYTTPVHASDISQERVDETAKREHDCNKCENRGCVLVDSQESYCENCIYGSHWKKDYYKEKNT